MMITIALLSSLLVAMPMPEAGMTPLEPVPFELAEGLALRRAEAEWPAARLGEVLPYLDETGRVTVWCFQFRTDGRPMPEYQQVADDIRREREALGPNTDLTQWRSDYAFVLVSARYDRPPILAWGQGVSEYYAVGYEARARAREMLGPDAELSRLYFDWPRVNLEFSAGGRQVILSARLNRAWRSRAEYKTELEARPAAAAYDGLAAVVQEFDAEATAAAHRQRWDDYLTLDFTESDEVYVPEHRRAPFYDWSYGCTPTSGAMVCGYIDRTRDFGRLVRWNFARYDPVRSVMTWQIPDAQLMNAVEMRTDTANNGGTFISWIGPGLREVFQNHGYSVSMTTVNGMSHNDWAWSTITAEINAGRSMIWSALWETHSLAAFGYRTPEKDVYVHNTWWQPAAWWHYSGPSQSHVASPNPSGGSPYKLELTWPLGDTYYNSTGRGEVLQVGDTAVVTWDNQSNPATRVEIDISYNCGRNWTPLATDLPDNGRYLWFIDSSTPARDSVRLRLRQYHGSTLVSADGSFGDFRMLREPIAPLSLAPPNGRQLFEGGVVLLVDSTRTDIDSIEFVLMQSLDTIFRAKGTEHYCAVPDSLFTFNRSYKWVTRGRNAFGWGDWGTPWTFWCRFHAGVAEERPGEPRVPLRVSALQARGAGVRFALGATPPGTRLLVYNALGVLVRELAVQPEVTWDGRDRAGRLLPAGLYFARLDIAGRLSTVRFLLAE